MKFIYNDRIYDTDDSDLMLLYKKCNTSCSLFGHEIIECDGFLYRTKEGNYFILVVLSNKTITKTITENEAKKILSINNYKEYKQLF